VGMGMKLITVSLSSTDQQLRSLQTAGLIPLPQNVKLCLV